jgi:hypothetical protein
VEVVVVPTAVANAVVVRTADVCTALEVVGGFTVVTCTVDCVDSVDVVVGDAVEVKNWDVVVVCAARDIVVEVVVVVVVRLDVCTFEVVVDVDSTVVAVVIATLADVVVAVVVAAVVVAAVVVAVVVPAANLSQVHGV